MPRKTTTAAPVETPRLVAVEVPKIERKTRASRFDAKLLDAALNMLARESINLDGGVPFDNKAKARRSATLARRALIEHGKLDPALLTARTFEVEGGHSYGLTLATDPPSDVRAAA
jgi:hypothetical protein